MARNLRVLESTTASTTRQNRILIIHAMPLMRLGMTTALATVPAFADTWVGGFATMADAAESFATLDRGDIVVLDLTAWSALEAERGGAGAALRARGVAIALAAPADQSASRVLEARGLAGVIAPQAAPDVFVESIIQLAAGQTLFCQKPGETASGLSRLSNRQFEILELMTRGLLNKQIAWELGLTEGTVKSHVSAILEKLGCDRRTQAITAFMQSFGVGRTQTMLVA